MQNITLNISFSRNKKYTVYIPDNRSFDFTSKRLAKSWKKSYERILTDNVKVINLHLSVINQVYRLYYFEFSDSDNTKLTDSLNNINTRFNFIFKQFSEGSNNHFVIRNVQASLASIIDFLSDLKSVAQLYKNYSLLSQLKPLLKVFCIMERQLCKDINSLDLDFSYDDPRSLKSLEHKSA